MIKYLEENEITESRKLYEEVFNDSLKFTDYYFNEHSGIYKILGCYIENNLISMMHLKQNHFFLKGNNADFCYIFAVATKTEYRHKGYMEELMKKALFDVYNEGIPLCYLIPEKAKTYYKFQFVTVSESSEELANPAKIEYDVDNFSLHEMLETDIDNLKEFVLKQLEYTSDFYKERSVEYFKDMIKNLKSENGNIEILTNNNKIKGYAYISNEDRVVITELYCIEDLDELFLKMISDKYISNIIQIKSPPIMIRVLRPELIAKYLRAKEEMCFTIKINDSNIESNNRVFKWKISKTESSMEIVNQDADYEMDISEFTEWIFDYKNFINMPEIDKIKNIHINEIL